MKEKELQNLLLLVRKFKKHSGLHAKYFSNKKPKKLYALSEDEMDTLNKIQRLVKDFI